MKLPVLLVADYANTTSDGKLNVMGIFQNISAVSFPTMHPEMYVIAQFAAGPAEYGRKFNIEIKLLNEDGAEVVSFSTEAQVPHGVPGQVINMPILLRLVNTAFQEPGTYQFSVLVDGDEKDSLSIQVNQLPASNAQA
jgi:hypothetical protein